MSKFIEFRYCPEIDDVKKTWGERSDVKVISINSDLIVSIEPYLVTSSLYTLMLCGNSKIIIAEEYEQVKQKLL